jgi:GNAT superfamily N-acetyltransferase
MGEVERLLTASVVRIDVVDPEQPAAAYCLGEYYAELGRRFDEGWNQAISIAATPEQLRPPAGLFAIATLHGAAVGCGALKFHGRRPTELKRMWVTPAARGLGLGRRLLTELERLAHDRGSRVLRLETNHNLTEAIALYRSAGYREVAPFNNEPYAHHWFEKRLPSHRTQRA